MPSHDYQIEIDGIALSTLVVHSRFVKWTGGMKRGNNLDIPYKHGQFYVPDKYFGASDVMLEVFLPSDTTDAGAEALSEIQKLLSNQTLVVVEQVDPFRGNIRANVELLTEPTQTANQFVWLFPLAMPSGFWEDVTASAAAAGTPPTVVTGGDRPIDDMTFNFAGPGYLEHTDAIGTVSRITIDAGAGAGTYNVDVGRGTVLKGGVPQDQWVSVTQPWWMKWAPDSSISLTSTVSVSAAWRNKWA